MRSAREIAGTIARDLTAGGDLAPGTPEGWGPADTADLPVREPDGSTWTVRVFKGLNDTTAEPAAAEVPTVIRNKHTGAIGEMTLQPGGTVTIRYYARPLAEALADVEPVPGDTAGPAAPPAEPDRQPILTITAAGLPARCGSCGEAPPRGQWPLTVVGHLLHATCPACWSLVAPVRATGSAS